MKGAAACGGRVDLYVDLDGAGPFLLVGQAVENLLRYLLFEVFDEKWQGLVGLVHVPVFLDERHPWEFRGSSRDQLETMLRRSSKRSWVVEDTPGLSATAFHVRARSLRNWSWEWAWSLCGPL